jgi:hypothetical protein
VPGYRPGRTPSGADDDDGDGTKRRAKTVGNGRGDGAVRRQVEAFRRGLGLLVIAHADAMRDSVEGERATEEERATSTTLYDDALWSRVYAAPVSAFLAVAEAERRRHGVAPPLIREETVARAQRGGRGGGRWKGRAACRCHGLEPLDVDAFIAPLTIGPDSLGGKGPCEPRLDVPARPPRLAPEGSPPPALRPAPVAALVASGVPLPDADPARLRLFSRLPEGICAALRG